MKSAQLIFLTTVILFAVLLSVRFWSIEPIFDLLPDSAEYMHGAYSVWSGKVFARSAGLTSLSSAVDNRHRMVSRPNCRLDRI